ncbi:MAG: hypothetical protein FIB01_07480 [Gemmatimonadetes bacterium]|nr:hypothetical protein [Gemmatimonadota bacterium]
MPARVLMQYQYDQLGNLVAGRDAYGNEFAFAYDAANRRIMQADRSGYSFFYAYDAEGRCVESWGQDGLHHVKLEYRLEDGLTFVTRDDGGRWTYRQEDGQLVAIIGPYGAARQFVHDETGMLRQELDALGNASRYVYDRAGAVAAIEPSPGPATEEEHRIAARPIEFDYGDLLTRAPIQLPTPSALARLRVPEEVRAVIWTA